jgi:hypothetical protein
VKVLILVPLAVLATFFAIGPGGIVSYTPATRLSVHSVQAFWVAIPAALTVLAFQRKSIRANVLLISALFFSIVLHLGSAAKNLIILNEIETVERVLADTVGDLLEFALFSIVVAGAAVCYSQGLTTDEPRISPKFLLPVSLIIPAALYGGGSFIFQIVAQEHLIILGWIFGVVAIIGFLITSILVPRIKEDDLPVDIGFLVSAILLLLVASLASMINMVNPSMNWEYAENLQMASYLLFCLALGVPFFKKSGYHRRAAYGFVIGLILMAYLPFLITILSESMSLNIILEEFNVLAYSIIHIGAASLSGMMAILLYIYPKKKSNHFPIILIFALWAVVSLLLVFVFAIPTFFLLGEPITPIVVGSGLTLALLYYAIRWTANPRERGEHPSLMNYALHTSFFVILVTIAETLNQIALNSNPELEFSPYGALVLLGTNLVIMFAFTYLVFLLSEDSGGIPPVEMYIAFFLGMWILPNILKSYNPTWTVGWWVSEILLFAGLLAGPPLLIWLYVRSMHEVEDSHKRVNMYADLLMHDVSNYNQMMMMSMELLGSHELPEDQRKRLADDGRQVISFSEQLISNVRLLSEADQLKTAELQPTNLVNTIVGALDLFTRRVGTGELIVEFRAEESQAFVMANDLLVHIFLNILYSALECRMRGESVTIGIHETEYSGENFWQIDIKAPGRSEEQEEGYSSGTLGLLAARLMTESLKGHFEMETFARTDVCEGRLFSIRLRATND